MSGEQYAILAYVVGLGLFAAYSLRIWVHHRTLLRASQRTPAPAPPAIKPPGLGALRVQKPVEVTGVQTASKRPERV